MKVTLENRELESFNYWKAHKFTKQLIQVVNEMRTEAVGWLDKAVTVDNNIASKACLGIIKNGDSILDFIEETEEDLKEQREKLKTKSLRLKRENYV